MGGQTVTFRLHIPGRLLETAGAANAANPLTRHRLPAANDAVAAEAISEIAGLAGTQVCEPDWEVAGSAALPPMSDAEAATFESRVARSILLGYPDAEERARRLMFRDREGDDRRLCIECRRGGPGWRCSVNAGFLLEQLQRCPSFVLLEA